MEISQSQIEAEIAAIKNSSLPEKAATFLGIIDDAIAEITEGAKRSKSWKSDSELSRLLYSFMQQIIIADPYIKNLTTNNAINAIANSIKYEKITEKSSR